MTLEELIATPPAVTAGSATQIEHGGGQWRYAVQIAHHDGVDWAWYDLTDYVEGSEVPLRGADEFDGDYRATVAQITLSYTDSDELAPWLDDNSAVFGTHIPLDESPLVRIAVFHVVDGAVPAGEWNCIASGDVERWPDVNLAAGQIREHTIEILDTLSSLAEAQIPALSEEGWYDRILSILAAVGWPYGVDIYGAFTFDSGSGPESTMTLPARPAGNALDELRQVCACMGLSMRTTTAGRLLIHPAHGDTFHSSIIHSPEVDGAVYTPAIATWYPAGVQFHYDATGDQVPFVEDLFGMPASRDALVNHVVMHHPADGGVPYEYEASGSITKFRVRRTVELNLMVANEDAADRIVDTRAFLTLQAEGLEVDIDHDGAFPAMLFLDHTNDLEVVYRGGPDRVEVTAVGRVRSVGHSITVRDTGRSLNWTLRVGMDTDSRVLNDPLLPVNLLRLTSLGPTSIVAAWENPVQPAVTATHVEIRIPEISPSWLQYPLPRTTWSHGALEPETPYTLQVRLLRIVGGVTTHSSPISTLQFITDPAPAPIIDSDGEGGFVITLPDVDDPDDCVINWTLQESDDGLTWTIADSGTLPGGSVVEVPVEELDTDKSYISCATEVCDGIEGETFCSYVVVPQCVTPPAYTAGDPPYDDEDLILFVPEACPPDRVMEAITGIQAARGPAFGGFFTVGDDDVALASTTAAGGVIAFNTADALAHAGSASIGCRVSVQNGEDIRLFSIPGLRIDCVDGATGWYPRASVTTVNGDEATITDPTERTLITPVEILVTYDAGTGVLELFVNEESVGTASVEEAANRATGNLWYIGAPAASWITDCAAWSKVLVSTPTALFSGGDVSICGTDIIHTFTASGSTRETFELTPLAALPPGGVDVDVLVVGAGKGWTSTSPDAAGRPGGSVVEDTVNVTGAVTVKVPPRWNRATADPGAAEFGAITAASGGANGNAAGSTLSSGNFANYRNTAYGGGAGAGGDGEDGVDSGNPVLGAVRGGSGGPGVYSTVPCDPGYFGAGGAGGGVDGIDSAGGGGFNNGPMTVSLPGLGGTANGGLNRIDGGVPDIAQTEATGYGEGAPGGYAGNTSPLPSNLGRGGPGVVIVRYTP